MSPAVVCGSCGVGGTSRQGGQASSLGCSRGGQLPEMDAQMMARPLLANALIPLPPTHPPTCTHMCTLLPGPDARVLRPDMQPMGGGWTLDHDTPAGKLYTVFSAPAYPQVGQRMGAGAGAGAPGIGWCHWCLAGAPLCYW